MTYIMFDGAFRRVRHIHAHSYEEALVYAAGHARLRCIFSFTVMEYKFFTYPSGVKGVKI